VHEHDCTLKSQLPDWKLYCYTDSSPPSDGGIFIKR